MLSRTNHFPVQGRSILITGGSQGLGEALAIHLAKKGANISSSRAPNRNSKLQWKKSRSGACVSSEQSVTSTVADPTVDGEARRVFISCDKVPDIVICCAGSATPGFIADQSTETLEFSVKSVYFTALWTAHSAINAMIRSPTPPTSPRRKIIFTSLVAFCAIPVWASYSPSRAAIRMLADTLGEECLLYDIDIHCIFPSNCQSPGLAEELKTKPLLTRELEDEEEAETAENVAKFIVERLERGDQHITYGFLASLVKNAMQGMTPRDNPVGGFLRGLLGWIAWPLVRGSWRKKIRGFKEEHSKRPLPNWPPSV